MRTSKVIGMILVVLMLIAGCATKPEKLPTTYVSTLAYKDYDCEQIAMEIDNISRRKENLYAHLKKTAKNDSAQMATGLLFWPTLFFLEGGDRLEATEYSRLKGEYAALQKVMVAKKCNVGFLPLSTEEIVKRAIKPISNQGALDE